MNLGQLRTEVTDSEGEAGTPFATPSDFSLCMDRGLEHSFVHALPSLFRLPPFPADQFDKHPEMRAFHAVE